MIECIHSAIAPNMNRCIKCGHVWSWDKNSWVIENETTIKTTDCPNVAERYKMRGYAVSQVAEQANSHGAGDRA